MDLAYSKSCMYADINMNLEDAYAVAVIYILPDNQFTSEGLEDKAQSGGKEKFKDVEQSLTYGFITKVSRIVVTSL